MTGSHRDRRVVAAVNDLFFMTKIQTTAAHLGIALVPVTNADELKERLGEAVPDLIVLDLNCASCDPFEWVNRIRSDSRFRETKVIGFFSHVQKDLGERARGSGFDLVLPRSRFSSTLADLLAGDFGAE